MRKIKPAGIRSLKDIALEKERFRYLALRTELEFSKQVRSTRNLFTIPNLLSHSQSLIASYLGKLVRSWFK